MNTSESPNRMSLKAALDEWNGVSFKYVTALEALAYPIITALVENNRKLREALQLVMKNSTNFRLKAPDYLIDKVESVIEQTDPSTRELP